MATSNENLFLLFLQMNLEPGCAIEAVQERYRILASLLHPDQITGEKRKQLAEAEMKLLNNRRDRILLHLRASTHNPQGDCECRRPPMSPYNQATQQQAQQPQQNQQTATQYRGSPSNPGQRRNRQASERRTASNNEHARQQQHERKEDPKAAQQPEQQRESSKQGAQSNGSPQSQNARAASSKASTDTASDTTQNKNPKPAQSGSNSSGGGTPPSGTSEKESVVQRTTSRSVAQGYEEIGEGIKVISSIVIVSSLLLALMSLIEHHRGQSDSAGSVRSFQKILPVPPKPSLTQNPPSHALPHIIETTAQPLPHRGGRIDIPVDPNPMPAYIKDLQLQKIPTNDLLDRTRQLTIEFRALLSEIQPQEAYLRNYCSGQIPRLYKRFNYVDNQKMLFENELRRRGYRGKIIV
ncbi:MAG TPA: hypothetical protein V6C97_17570 [Oculatellaceae cyanobacterium]